MGGFTNFTTVLVSLLQLHFEMIKIITTIIAAIIKMDLRFIQLNLKVNKSGCEKSIKKKSNCSTNAMLYLGFLKKVLERGAMASVNYEDRYK